MIASFKSIQSFHRFFSSNISTLTEKESETNGEYNWLVLVLLKTLKDQSLYRRTKRFIRLYPHPSQSDAYEGRSIRHCKAITILHLCLCRTIALNYMLTDLIDSQRQHYVWALHWSDFFTQLKIRLLNSYRKNSNILNCVLFC